MEVEQVGNRHNVDDDRLSECEVKVASIRNPFDVLTSWYLYKQNKDEPFFDFLKRMWESKSAFFSGTCLPNADKASQVIRYEVGVEDHLNYTLDSLGYPGVRIPHVGQAVGRKPFWDYYDAESRSAVELMYEKDLEIFDYRFEDH